MRVGYVTGCYPRASDTFIQREVDGLRRAGVQVHSFAVRTPSDAELVGPEQRQERASTTYLLAAGPAALARAHVRLALSAPGRWAATARLAWATRQPGVRGTFLQAAYFAEAGLLARLVRNRSLDHLHNHFGDSSGSVTMLAAELAAVSWSMTVHGPDVFYERSRWRLDVKSERAAFVVCISKFAKSQLMTVAPPHRWDDLHVVHCGVDPSGYGEPPPAGVGLRLLTVGRLERHKGLPLLLEAVRRVDGLVPGLHLDLVGDGPDRALLEDEVRRRRIEHLVRFHGARSAAEVRARMSSADVLVMASFAEGLPVVLIEALAARIPVVAPRIMGIPELVEDGIMGRLCAPADVDSLVVALLEMSAAGPEGRRAMGDAGRRAVEKGFDITEESGRLAQLFDRYTTFSKTRVVLPAGEHDLEDS